ncbi:MAG: TIGR02710 family CRISPR-associated protein [Kaiparowitsia implicata GSE-PSE-MK54-09C]|jgi:CRISPR-associated protein (TIGR02710 family)|nr:TIGR02710 family CRISPR-associated protein [Kaiparowitsia implicata GSE-PSE-MK54-09C]
MQSFPKIDSPALMTFMSILFLTVGGSPAPILTAIQSLRPDRTIFICSSGPRGSLSQITGEGNPCEIRRGAEVVDRQPNIPTQLGMGTRFNADTDLVLLDNPDDLAECYRLIAAKINAIQRESPGGELYADYTGGTKTMSLSLAMSALDYGVSLYLTTNATRENLFRVERGQSTERAPTTLLTVERALNQDLPRLLQDFNYSGAIATLQALLQSLELPADQKRHIRQQRDLCAGFDAWDRFDHLAAWDLLSMHLDRKHPHALALKRVLTSRQAIDPNFTAPTTLPGHGYELVEDLLLNAQRRAHQQRYDDAVGRLYRALELLAQIRLKQHYDLETGDLDVTKLPEFLRETYVADRNPRTGKIQIPLWKSYLLLSQLLDDPLGRHFQPQANRLQDALHVRNQSLLAHGFTPVTNRDYQNSGQVIQTFIETALDALIPGKQRSPLPQFPTDFGSQ